MAEDLGRRLLSEVVEVRLDEILGSLRSLEQEKNHSSSHKNVFDWILHSGYDHIRPQAGLKPRLPVLEICSEDTGAGKSQLLYLLTAVAVLPDVHASIAIGGKHGAVVVFDTDGRFEVARLAQVMTAYIKSKSHSAAAEIDTDTLISRSLQHVHIFQPQSMRALLDILSHLKEYLFDSSAHFSSRRAVHAIIVDSAGAFQFQTRADHDKIRLAALDTKDANDSRSLPTVASPYAELTSRLRALQQTLNCAIIATSHLSYYEDSITNQKSPRTLPTVWTGFLTARLAVKRQAVGRFAPGFSWEEAVRDKVLRQTEVEKGVFMASLLSGRECFRFSITKQGVELLSSEGGIEESEV